MILKNEFHYDKKIPIITSCDLTTYPNYIAEAIKCSRQALRHDTNVSHEVGMLNIGLHGVEKY